MKLGKRGREGADVEEWSSKHRREDFWAKFFRKKYRHDLVKTFKSSHVLEFRDRHKESHPELLH